MELLLGNCLDRLKDFEDNSVDAIVTDPPYGLSFMGSGTTGMACKKLNREFIGMEMMPEYMEIAKARIEGVQKEDQLNMI
jgi:DNA modification methylase